MDFSIPEELEDAAMIDGCNRVQAYFRVVLPLVRPALLAVAMFAARQPDAVLMDIAMPRQDGLAATARIRAHSPTARVIIVSQHDDASFRQAAAQAGATAFVSKLDLQPLRQLLGLQHGATQAPSSDEPQPPIPGAPSPPTKL